MSTNQPFDYSMLPAAITGVISVALFITSFVLTSMALGSDSKWEKVRSEVMTKVWPLTLIGTIVFFAASIIYLLQEPKSMMYFLLVVSCLSLGISYSTLVMSVMST